MRKEVILAIAGFVVGAATLAGGDEESDLREELGRLQREAARAMQRQWEVEGTPPSDDRGNQLGFFPIEDLTYPRYDFIPPSHMLDNEDSESPLFGGVSEEGVLPFGTGEEIMELVRMSVDPAAWEEGLVNLAGETLAVMSRPATVGRVRSFLDRTIRPRAHRGVAVDFEVVSLPRSVAQRLRGSTGVGLSKQQRAAIDGALEAGRARRVIGLRAAGTLGARFLVWHGRQVAVVGDFEVEVAQTASTADPVVQIVQDGGYVAVRAATDDAGKEITLDLGLRLEELRGIRRHETRKSGDLDLPDLADQQSDVNIRTPNGVWTVVASGMPNPGDHRLFLVRASLLERGGAR
jgi:hypothetical protein